MSDDDDDEVLSDDDDDDDDEVWTPEGTCPMCGGPAEEMWPLALESWQPACITAPTA
jgi:hypothetical protein